ncbi:helix-turn-helix transcriptional regulator [Amycolatopsis thermoflava]|uniref:helix-turn-helix transcriptional regulator n=1 Tax=Amycolatopsis thermoflava TaxID=84480 RepID=UPI0036581462
MTAHDPGGERRRQVLQAIQRATEPVGVARIAEQVGIHPNTARFHLDALVDAGIVERIMGTPSGPGRPRAVYLPRPGRARGDERRYRMLAEILLGYVTSTTTEPAPAATEMGRAWGAHLIDRPVPSQTITRAGATDRLVAMLDDLGFAPEAVPRDGGVPDRVLLRHCPFLELAERHRDIVCPLHLGLMQGALSELRAPVTATALEPFAEPDACVTHLAPANARTA